MKVSLASIWTCALRNIAPGAILERKRIVSRVPRDSALLFWGKAARATAREFPESRFPGPRMVISPEVAEHPFPGLGSFRQGRRLLAFFDRLSKVKSKRLTVFISGGASSLAWVRPDGLDSHDLSKKLRKLYSEPLTIERLNRERSKLCLLKSGGAARYLRAQAPRLKVRVFVISDVAPFRPEVVGSGPFKGLPHHILASNRDWVIAAANEARRRGDTVLETRHSLLGAEKDWADALSRKIRRQLSQNRGGLFIWGGEPRVRLPKDSLKRRGKRRGGRQSQIAARLLNVFWDEIREGRVEILCASSDGSDGNSGASAIHLRGPLSARSVSLQRQLKKAIARFDTAPILGKLGMTIPKFQTGTNLQDLVMVRVLAS